MPHISGIVQKAGATPPFSNLSAHHCGTLQLWDMLYLDIVNNAHQRPRLSALYSSLHSNSRPTLHTGAIKHYLKSVGARRFELPTPCSRSRCATKLRYAPSPLNLSKTDRMYCPLSEPKMQPLVFSPCRLVLRFPCSSLELWASHP